MKMVEDRTQKDKIKDDKREHVQIEMTNDKELKAKKHRATTQVEGQRSKNTRLKSRDQKETKGKARSTKR